MNEKRTLTIRPWLLVMAVCLIYVAIIGVAYRNVLEFVRIGTRYDSVDYSRDAYGYDGQFAYYIARDPLTAPLHLDVPAYRYQRIVYPALARLLSFGQMPLIPYVMILINLIALTAGTALLEGLLVAERVSRWYALTYGLFSGVFIAVRASTNEALAYALVIAAIAAMARSGLIESPKPIAEGGESEPPRFSPWWVIISTALFGLAALTKETTLFFPAGYVLYLLVRRRWDVALTVALGSIVPFALWQVYLHGWLGAWGIGSGGAGATPFEIIPFNGIWQIAGSGLTAFVLFGVIPLAGALLPTVWALWRTIADVWARRWHPYVFLLLSNAAIMPFVPFSTYREPLGIFRFMVGLVISVVLYAALRKARRVLNYSTLWIVIGAQTWG